MTMWKQVLRSSVACVLLLAAPGVAMAEPRPYQTLAKTPAKAPPKTPAAKVDAAAAAREHMRKAVTLYDAGQPEQALAEADAAIKLDSRSMELLAARGYLPLETGNVDGAIGDFDAAMALDPNVPPGYAIAVAYYGEKKDYAKALEIVDRQLVRDPADPVAQAVRVAILLEQGDKARALEAAQALAAAQPDSPMSTKLLAETYGLSDQHGKATEVLRAASLKFPDDPDLHTDLAERLFSCQDKAVTCATQRAEAVEVYGKVIAIAPSADAYVWRAQSRPQTDRDGKFADLDAALALEPDSQFVILTRGAVYFNYKETDKALVDVNTALAMDPEDDEALALRARIYGRQNNVDAALRDLDALTVKLPDKAEHFNSACWLRATHKRELDKALEQCNAALALKPGYRQYLDSRGMVHLQMARWDEAIADYDAALAQETYSIGLYGRGIAKLGKRLKKEGKADLKAAKKLEKDIADTFAGYGIKP